MDLRNFTFQNRQFVVAFELTGTTVDSLSEPLFTRMNIFELGVCSLTLLEHFGPRNRYEGATPFYWEIRDTDTLTEYNHALMIGNVNLYDALVVSVNARVENNELIVQTRLSRGCQYPRLLQTFLVRNDPRNPGFQ